MQNWTNEDGLGSFDSMVEYVEQVLSENFVPIPERNVGMHNPHYRRARNIVTSLLAQLDIKITYSEARMVDKKSHLQDAETGQTIGETKDLGDGSVEITITDPEVKQDMLDNPEKYEVRNIQLPETD